MLKKAVIAILMLTCLICAEAGYGAVATSDGSAAYGEKNKLSALSFNLSPAALIPLGESSDLYKVGFGVGLAGEYQLKSSKLFFLSGNFGYGLAPLQADQSLSLLSLGAGGGVKRGLTEKLSLKGFVHGGGYFASLSDSGGFGESTAMNPYVTVGAGLYYQFTPALSAGIETGYKNYFGLYNGVLAALGSVLHIGGIKKAEKSPAGATPPAGNHIELLNLEFDDVFPVFFKYYDENPIGKATIRNREKEPVTDISVNLFVKQYMDSPKKCLAPAAMGQGEAQPVELSALFTEKVLEITEGTKVAADITVDYKYNGRQYRYTRVETLSLYDRNATRWDDDRKAAAFVTAKDPVVLRFAKNTAGLVKGSGYQAVNQNLKLAMAIHESLRLFGMSYAVDPTSSYAEFSKNKQAVDYLQFPKQSLAYKAGDCDDLSILFCALLESIGIETAFITTPGHIHIAFSTDMGPGDVKKSFLRNDDLIIHAGKAWVPVEVTAVDRGFVKAWELGAKLWREASGQDKAGFYPVREAWKVFSPVGLPGEGETLTLPVEEEVLNAYNREVFAFVDREISPQVSSLQAEIQKSGGSPRLINKLGVLYARYGLVDKAEKEFMRILEKNKDYVPALLNLGNINFMRDDMTKAKVLYDKAAAGDPDNPDALLCIARVNHELENYDVVRVAFQKLKVLEPELAAKYSYLDLGADDATRAANRAGVGNVVEWSD